MLSARPCGPDVANEEPAVHAPRTAFSMPLTQPAVTSLFTSFKPVSEEDVRALITKAPIKYCPLDPIPSSVLEQLLDVLIPVIKTMINLSFETGQFARDWNEALLLPALKKAGLEVAFKNFRPISNLPFVSKLSEREAADQLMQHAVDQGLVNFSPLIRNTTAPKPPFLRSRTIS